MGRPAPFLPFVRDRTMAPNCLGGQPRFSPPVVAGTGQNPPGQQARLAEPDRRADELLLRRDGHASHATQPRPSAAAARRSRTRPPPAPHEPLPVRSRWNRNSAAIASPAPFTETGSRGVRIQVELSRFGREQIDRAGRRRLGAQAGQQHGPRPGGTHPLLQSRDRRLRLIERQAGKARQMRELEGIGRREIGVRQRPIAYQLRDAGRGHRRPRPSSPITGSQQ